MIPLNSAILPEMFVAQDSRDLEQQQEVEQPKTAPAARAQAHTPQPSTSAAAAGAAANAEAAPDIGNGSPAGPTKLHTSLDEATAAIKVEPGLPNAQQAQYQSAVSLGYPLSGPPPPPVLPGNPPAPQTARPHPPTGYLLSGPPTVQPESLPAPQTAAAAAAAADPAPSFHTAAAVSAASHPAEMAAPSMSTRRAFTPTPAPAPLLAQQHSPPSQVPVPAAAWTAASTLPASQEAGYFAAQAGEPAPDMQQQQQQQSQEPRKPTNKIRITTKRSLPAGGKHVMCINHRNAVPAPGCVGLQITT